MIIIFEKLPFKFTYISRGSNVEMVLYMFLDLKPAETSGAKIRSQHRGAVSQMTT